jgi:hypothetical protein
MIHPFSTPRLYKSMALKRVMRLPGEVGGN